MPLTEEQIKFENLLQSFVAGCAKISEDHTKSNFPGLTPDTFSVTRGNKYIRVVRAYGNGGGTSVHCFVDLSNGDVLKAASWKSPAKHARGNIFDEHNGLERMNPYGPAYLK